MAVWLIGAVVALVGLAHAIAAWLYFARSAKERWWLWSLGWVLATAGCIAAARTDAWLGYGLFAALVAAWTAWWIAIRASSSRNWTPENRYQATGMIDGNTMHIRRVRNFEWLGKHSFHERWEDRVYDLASLTALDVFVSTWGDPRIAHVMLSFDFADRAPLCFSIETRRKTGDTWTALAGFMKSYELVIIAGDERDLVRSRINIRGENVHLYRIATTAIMRRKVLQRTVAQMNGLATRPRFYNTIFHNCTIEIARVVWATGQHFPLDWRILVSGYVPEYLYDIGLLDGSRTFAALKANADIRTLSLAADTDPRYSQRIREGLADPNSPSLTVPTAS